MPLLSKYRPKLKTICLVCLTFAALLCFKAVITVLFVTKVSYIKVRVTPTVHNNSYTPTEDIDYNTDKISITNDELGDISITSPTNTSEGDFLRNSNSSNTTVQYEDSYYIVFIIPTHPSKITIRQAIRETWANVSAWSLLANEEWEDKKKIRLMFVFGALEDSSNSTEFQEELSQNDDMFVVSNIKESYYTLRYKVLWGIEYSSQHFNYKFLVKTDDDIMVNLPVLVRVMSSFTPGLRYVGRCVNIRGRAPQRWRYCSGGGYVLSRDLVGHILNLPDSVHNVTMKPEDVFTGWLVWNVNNLNNVYNTTEFAVKPRYRYRALSLGRYNCGPLNKWFYHGYKGKKYDYRVKAFREFFMNNSTIECGNKDTIL